jgi:hypothetical protein
VPVVVLVDVFEAVEVGLSIIAFWLSKCLELFDPNTRFINKRAYIVLNIYIIGYENVFISYFIKKKLT